MEDPFEKAQREWNLAHWKEEIIALNEDLTNWTRNMYAGKSHSLKCTLYLETIERNEFLFSGSTPEDYENTLTPDEIGNFSYFSQDEKELDMGEPPFLTEEETEEKYFDLKHLLLPVERSWPPLIRLHEYNAILWLSRKLEYDFSNLVKVIERIRKGEILYDTTCIPKSNGQTREIQIPYKFLKNIQRKISKNVLSEFEVNKNVFGFSRGDIKRAIKPHLKAKSILCVDCENAFPTVGEKHIMNMLTEGWGIRYFSSNKKRDHGKFSWYVARIITELTICNEMLPQGAPTSPKIFDLVCKDMDRKLSDLAKNVKGEYTRYADNIFFSFHEEHFPTPIKRAILDIIQGKRRSYEPAFFYHKLRIKVLEENSVRILGLNMIDGKIHNTKDFKLRVRKAIHHLNWVLDNRMDPENAWNKLQGLNSFSQKDTWPENLREDYENVKKRIKKLKE